MPDTKEWERPPLPKKPPTKLKQCAGTCQRELDRFDEFAPRWGHCPKHKPWEDGCDDCQYLRSHPTRQPQCYGCDRARAKKASASKGAKGTGGKRKPKAATAPKTTKATTDAPATSEPPASESSAALIAVGAPPPNDSHGPLTRLPSIPKRAIAVRLRRSLATFKNRCDRAAVWEKKVRDTKAKVGTAKTRDDGSLAVVQARLAGFQVKLGRAITARTFTEKSIRQCAEAMRTRTLTNPAVKTRCGSKPFERLLSLVDDTIDTAYLQAGGSGASDAFSRIVSRTAPHYGKLVALRVRSESMRTGNKQLAEETARALRDEGIYKGAQTWNPNHKSKATLATRCYMPVLRALQIRTKADRAIGVLKDEEGKWQSGAVSLDALAVAEHGGEAGGSFEPYAERYSLRGCTQHVGAHAQDQDRRVSIISDVTSALDDLDNDIDREIARRIMIVGESRKAVAEGMKCSVTVVNARLQVILDSLRTKLAAYADEGDL